MSLVMAGRSGEGIYLQKVFRIEVVIYPDFIVKEQKITLELLL
jgi:hypothetical protein